MSNYRMSTLFKDLFNAYCRDVQRYNSNNDRCTLCSHLFIPPDTLNYLIEGVKRLHQQGEAIESKIITRLLLQSITYEELCDIFCRDEVEIDGDNFRDWLNPHDSTDDLDPSNPNNYEQPVPF